MLPTGTCNWRRYGVGVDMLEADLVIMGIVEELIGWEPYGTRKKTVQRPTIEIEGRWSCARAGCWCGCFGIWDAALGLWTVPGRREKVVGIAYAF